MRCGDTEKLIKKYELGELDFLETKILKKHLEKCPVCKKKYASLIALNLLLANSKKSISASLVSNVFKGTLVKSLLGLFAVGAITMLLSTGEDNRQVQVNELITEPVETSASEVLDTESTTKASLEEKKTGVNGNILRIRAKSGSKEINVDIDDGNMKIKNREEN